jgi:hypothetical protein
MYFRKVTGGSAGFVIVDTNGKQKSIIVMWQPTTTGIISGHAVTVIHGRQAQPTDAKEPPVPTARENCQL